MEVRIGNSSEHITITDFVPEGEVFGYDPRNNEFLRATIQLQMNEISSNIAASFMISELKQFQTDLQRLYDTLKYGIKFENLENNIELTLKPTPHGQINIVGILKNSNYTGTIEFEIETDQSYLPGTIASLKEVFREMKIE